MGADLRGTYNPEDKPFGDSEVLPAGNYTVKVIDGEWKDASTGNGQYLQVKMVVVDGDHKDAVIYDRFNLKNKNEKAAVIAGRQFAGLREAVGVLQPKQISELCGIRFQVVLRCKKNEYTNKAGVLVGGMQNEVARYIKHGEGPATPQQSPIDAPWGRNTPPSRPGQSAASSPEMPF